nr:DUF6538 domain-containing protein [uncultured Undibacterium sp.]
MKSISQNLFQRGKSKIFYVRRRIPSALLTCYDGRTEIVRSLQTGDKAEAQKLLRIAMVKIDEEFSQFYKERKERNEPCGISSQIILTDEHIQSLAQFWIQQVLCRDELVRSSGMSDEEFDELGVLLLEQRDELGRLLAKGQVQRILPALQSFLHLCEIKTSLSSEQSQRFGYKFLEAIVSALDIRLARQSGNIVRIDPAIASAIPPKTLFEENVGWIAVFDVWKNYVEDRPKSTVIAFQTPWGQLQRFVESKNISAPQFVEQRHISDFVEHMKNVGLSIKTINGRLSKLKEIFKIAAGKQILPTNPAEKALGFKESAEQKSVRKRLPFTVEELNVIFGAEFFTSEKRSIGQAGEASYWLPLMMFYTGARPEEIAGLQVADIKTHPTVGLYFDISDLADPEDVHLFEDEKLKLISNVKKRRLKNSASRRLIPVAQELIDLGFLRYVESINKNQNTALFPTLKQDCHGKLSGALSKWFGRQKIKLGFRSKKKVLYSLRHSMKNFMEEAQIPSKYLKRILGHASGDGSVTDGYGDDIPLTVIHEHFTKIKFPSIPAKPWRLSTNVRQIK